MHSLHNIDNAIMENWILIKISCNVDIFIARYYTELFLYISTLSVLSIQFRLKNNWTNYLFFGLIFNDSVPFVDWRNPFLEPKEIVATRLRVSLQFQETVKYITSIYSNQHHSFQRKTNLIDTDYYESWTRVIQYII